MKFLAVEDGIDITGALLKGLSDLDHVIAEDGDELVEVAAMLDIDVILCGRLRDMNPVTLTSRLRRSGVALPLVFVGQFFDVEQRIAMLQAGADAVIMTPVKPSEVRAVADAVMRRANGRPDNVVYWGPAVVDLNHKSISVGGERVPLTASEYRVIEILLDRRGQVVGKEAMLTRLYNGMDEAEIKIVDVFICKARKKLIAAMGGNYVETVWGQGYRISDSRISTMGHMTDTERAANLLMSRRGVLLAFLSGAAGAVSIDDVNAGAGLAVNQLPSTKKSLSSSEGAGLVVGMNRGVFRYYEITEAGRAWLANLGFQSASVEEAA